MLRPFIIKVSVLGYFPLIILFTTDCYVEINNKLPYIIICEYLEKNIYIINKQVKILKFIIF